MVPVLRSKLLAVSEQAHWPGVPVGVTVIAAGWACHGWVRNGVRAIRNATVLKPRA